MSLFRENALPLYVATESDAAESMAAMIFSASRIGTWIACNRKAAWQYFAGYGSPETKAMALGTAVHAVLEASVPALTRGEACEIDRTTEIGAIAAEIVPHIPTAAIGAGTRFEQEFIVQGRHTWRGFIDLSAPGIVVDFKTTSDMRYMRTVEELATDPQAALYAEQAFRAYPELDQVVECWIYTRTRGARKAQVVETVVDRAATHAMFEVFESFADEMQAAANAAPPKSDPVALHKYILTVHGNEDRCNDYGGCPHKARCGIFFQDPNRPKDTHHMSPLERLQAMTALNGGAANAPTTTSYVTPSPPTTPVALPQPTVASMPALPPTPPSALFARLAAEGTQAPLAPTTQAIIDAEVKRAEGINPPKRPRGRPKADTVPAPAMPQTGTVTASNIPELPAGTPVTVSDSGAVTPRAAVGPDAQPCAVLASLSAKPIETLCVGCMPFGHDFVSLDTVLAEVRDMITPAVYFGGYGYKTNGMVIEGVTKLVAARGTIEVLVVPDPRLPEAVLVLSQLRAMSAVVIEAIR